MSLKLKNQRSKLPEVDFEMDDVVDDGFDDLPPIPGMDEAIDAIPEPDLDDELGFDQEDAPSPFALQGEDLNFELSNDSLGYEESMNFRRSWLNRRLVWHY